MAETAQLPAVRPLREVRVVEDDGPLGFLFDTARFEHMQRIAGAMASASLIPAHLKGNGQIQEATANCFLVVNQAVRWQMDPFAVAPETYSIGGKLGYQGKLIAAVVNARGGLDGRLNYTFTGAGDQREVTVSGTFRGEAEPRIVTLMVKDAKTKNEMWTKDPDQKLIYSGAIKWARRWCPEIVLGVLTDDDLERMALDRANAPERPKRGDFLGAPIASAASEAREAASPAEEEPDDFDADLFAEGFLSRIKGAADPAGVQRLIYDNHEELRRLDEDMRGKLISTANARAVELEAAGRPPAGSPSPVAAETTTEAPTTPAPTTTEAPGADVTVEPTSAPAAKASLPKDLATDWYDKSAGHQGCAAAMIEVLAGAKDEDRLDELLTVPEREKRIAWLKEKAPEQYQAVRRFIEKHRGLLQSMARGS